MSAPTTTFDPSSLTTDGLERLLTLCEAEIGRLRGIQTQLIREAQARQLPCADGARTLVDWISSRLDINPETAQNLQRVACSGTPTLDEALDTGASFDRVAECARTGDTDLHLELDLPGLRRLQARRHRVTRRNEADAHARRHLIIQPDLFDTSWTLRGLLPALEGAVVSQVLDHLADTIPDTRGVTPDPRHARRADALVQLCTQDATSASDDASPIPVTTTVIVDARETHRGETGGWIVSGPRVGPTTLEQILCGSPVEVTALTSDGTPLAVGTATTAIPPRTRRFVFARDGGCVIDGCTSVHRLQPHHITPRSAGGDNHPQNLASLCWYHHHVVVHRRGYRIDPTSPPLRRRLLRPRTGSDPPRV